METLTSPLRANISPTYSSLVLKIINSASWELNFQMHFGASGVKYQICAITVNYGPSVLVHKILILCEINI